MVQYTLVLSKPDLRKNLDLRKIVATTDFLVQWNLDLRKPDLRKNLDLRKIVGTTDFLVQQGLEIHGLKECGPWRYTVFNWIPKHLRYTVLGQKP